LPPIYSGLMAPNPKFFPKDSFLKRLMYL
jgi:hypothetical protein